MISGSGRTALAALAAAVLMAAAPADRPIPLQVLPLAAPGIAAFPRIDKPGDAAAARINRTLSQADQRPGCDDHKGS